MENINKIASRDKTSQGLFEIKQTFDYHLEDFFVSKSNQVAYYAVQQEILGIQPYQNILLIEGPKSCGKTFLAQVISRLKDGFFISSAEEISKNTKSLYIVDDAESIAEEDLLHIFNICSSYQLSLIILARHLNDIILQDLSSRIKSIHKVSIQEPDDELMAVMITREFSKRSISVGHEVIQFLQNKLDRNYEAIVSQIEAIDKFCLQNKKNINVRSVAELLHYINPHL